MTFLVAVLWAIAFTVAAELLRPKQTPPDAQASSIGELKIPTAEEGRPIPVIFGTCFIAAPNVTWYGNLDTDPITKKVRTGLFGRSKVTVGYKYFISMEMMLCHGPIDKIIGIKFGDLYAEDVTDVTYADGWAFDINDDDLFGGDEEEGGVEGRVRIRAGTATQSADSHIQSLIDSPIPAFRRVATAVFEEFYFGTSPYFKTVGFAVARFPNNLGLEGDHHIIQTVENRVGVGNEPPAPKVVAEDANPAEMIYECMTNVFWGASIPADVFDIDTFKACGETLWAEGMGLSMQLMSQPTVEDFIGEVLKHIDGAVYTDLTTGLVTMVLARKDYEVDDLFVIDESNVNSLNFQRTDQLELKNTIKLSYIDRENDFTERVISVQNLALITARNGEISVEEVSMQGFSNARTATYAASRMLQSYGYPLAKIEVTGNRALSSLKPAQVVRVEWEQDGISAIFRVGSIDYGTLNDPTVKATLVEDVFSVAGNAYDPPEQPDWQAPDTSVEPIEDFTVQEFPEYELKKLIERSELITLPVGVGFAQVLVPKQPDSNYLDYKINDGIDTSDDAWPFSESGVLGANINQVATTMNVAVSLGFVPTYALIGGKEYVRIISQAGLIFTIDRGVLDTVAQTHTGGEQVFFFGRTDGDEFGAEPFTRSLGDMVNYKVLPRTANRELDVDEAVAKSLLFVGRKDRPYPPGQLRINTEAYPTSTELPMLISWKHRDRTTQTLEGDSSDNIGPEAGVTYTVQVLDAQNQILAEETGITGTEATPNIFTGGALKIAVFSVREGIESYQKHLHPIDVISGIQGGWNYNWGAAWGQGPASIQTTTFYLSGVPDSGGKVNVILGGKTFTYTMKAGDTTLAQVAQGIASLIDYDSSYRAVANNASFTVTGLPRATYSVEANVEPSSGPASAVITEVLPAAPARPGNRMTVFFRWTGPAPNYSNSEFAPTLPTTFGLRIVREAPGGGSYDRNYSITWTAYIGQANVRVTASNQLGQNAVSALSADGISLNHYTRADGPPWPSDWAADFDDVSSAFNNVLVFPAGELVVGTVDLLSLSPGDWGVEGYTSPSQPDKALLEFGFPDGFEEKLEQPRAQWTGVQFSHEAEPGIIYRVKIDSDWYRYDVQPGDTTAQAMLELVDLINTNATEFVPNTARTELRRNGNTLELTEFRTNDSPMTRVLTSTDGETFVQASIESGLVRPTPQGLAFHANAGSIYLGIAFAINLENEASTLRVVYKKVGAAATTVNNNFPKDTSNRLLNVGGIVGDGSTFYMVGNRSTPAPSYANEIRLYSSTDGLTYTDLGLMTTDGADPNAVAVNATEGFRVDQFVYSRNLSAGKTYFLKSGTRWFMWGLKAIYYRDSSLAIGGWRRVATGLDFTNSNVRNVFLAGSKLVVVSANDLSECVAISNDNGNTWGAPLRPAALVARPFNSLALGSGIAIYFEDLNIPKVLTSADGVTWAVANVTGFQTSDSIADAFSIGSRIALTSSDGRTYFTDNGSTLEAASVPSTGVSNGTNALVTANIESPLIAERRIEIKANTGNVPFTVQAESLGGETTFISYGQVEQPYVPPEPEEPEEPPEPPVGGYGTYERPLKASSPWNTRIPETGINYINDARTTLFRSKGDIQTNALQYNIPIYVADADDPFETFAIADPGGGRPGSVTIRVPSNAIAAGGTDAHLIIINDDIAHELYHIFGSIGDREGWAYARVPLNSAGVFINGEGAQAVFGNYWNPAYPSFGWGSIRAYGGSALGGLIRVGDFTTDVEPHHALMMSIDQTLLMNPPISPASKDDGTGSGHVYTGNIRMGTRFAIPRSVSLAALSPVARRVAKWLQEYGAIVVDKSTGHRFNSEQVTAKLEGKAFNDLSLSERNWIRDQMRVIEGMSEDLD